MGITLSLGQMVSDCDFIRMIQHAVKGIPVEDETLAVDVIHDVGFSRDCSTASVWNKSFTLLTMS